MQQRLASVPMYSSIVSHATRHGIHHHRLHWAGHTGRSLYCPAKPTVRRYRDDSLLWPHLSLRTDQQQIIAIYILLVRSHEFLRMPAAKKNLNIAIAHFTTTSRYLHQAIHRVYLRQTSTVKKLIKTNQIERINKEKTHTSLSFISSH